MSKLSGSAKSSRIVAPTVGAAMRSATVTRASSKVKARSAVSGRFVTSKTAAREPGASDASKKSSAQSKGKK